MYSLDFTLTFFKTSCSLSHSFELSFDITGCKEKNKRIKIQANNLKRFYYKDVYKQLCITCTLISCSVVGDRSPFRPFWAASCSAANFSACNLSSSALAEAIRAASAASAGSCWWPAAAGSCNWQLQLAASTGSCSWQLQHVTAGASFAWHVSSNVPRISYLNHTSLMSRLSYLLGNTETNRRSAEAAVTHR